jgi:hypothetical protein
VSLFREADRTLIAGDAVTTVKQESLLAVWAQAPAIHPPPAYYTIDWPAAAASLRGLAGLAPDTLATGHGRPMGGGEMRAALEALARHFEDAMPRRGRYVAEPARADERGVTRVPPAERPGVAPWLLAAIVAVIAVYGYRRARGSGRSSTGSCSN